VFENIYQKLFSDVKGVEMRRFLIPKRSDEVSSTLPRLEEEPQDSSYAAAGGLGGTGGPGSECYRTREVRASGYSTSAAGGGRELMMWNVFRRLKSWSETKFTAAGAVVKGLPLKDQRQSKQLERGEI
jgi:hypothetical protein